MENFKKKKKLRKAGVTIVGVICRSFFSEAIKEIALHWDENIYLFFSHVKEKKVDNSIE